MRTRALPKLLVAVLLCQATGLTHWVHLTLEEPDCPRNPHRSGEFDFGADGPVLASAAYSHGHSARAIHDPATCPVCQAMASLKSVSHAQPIHIAPMPVSAERVTATIIFLPSDLSENSLTARAPPAATSLAVVS